MEPIDDTAQKISLTEFIVRLKFLAAGMEGESRERMLSAIQGIEDERDVIAQILATIPDEEGSQ